MSAPLRVAGWGTLEDGAAITWTVAEGRRGRRWREVVARGDAVRHSLLLETGVDGRFSHLELAEAGGLWTLHSEPDSTLHGNHVDPSGRIVHHVAGLLFVSDDLLLVDGSPLATAAVAWHLAASVPVGAAGTFSGVVLRPAGGIEALETIRVERQSESAWTIGEGQSVEIDAGGLPVLADGETRPLEVD